MTGSVFPGAGLQGETVVKGAAVERGRRGSEGGRVPRRRGALAATVVFGLLAGFGPDLVSNHLPLVSPQVAAATGEFIRGFAAVNALNSLFTVALPGRNREEWEAGVMAKGIFGTLAVAGLNLWSRFGPEGLGAAIAGGQLMLGGLINAVRLEFSESGRSRNR